MSNDINELKKRLNVFFNHNSPLVARYIQTYGLSLSMKNINELRAQVEKELDIDEGEDPIYNIKVECPVCKTQNIDFHELKAKSQIIYYDQFHTPLYLGINAYKSVKFSHFAIAICPKCYFASPDKKDFNTINLVTQKVNPSKLSPSILSELFETMGERLTIVDEIPDREGLFVVPRNFMAAINSYRLGIERLNVEIRHREPYAYFKKGAYWLKIALIQRQNSITDFPALEMAAECFKKAFLNSDFPNAQFEYQAIYSVFAIYMRIDRIEEGQRYLQVMDKVKGEFESGHRSDKEIPLAYKAWKDRATTLWEAREDHDLWDIPTPKTYGL